MTVVPSAQPLSHDDVLQAKINTACNLIEQVLLRYKNPCVLCSFGKDSILMLHMIREWHSKEIPVVFFRQPHFQRKYQFADHVTGLWDLELHANIPPAGVSITHVKGRSELVQHFQSGAKQILMPLGRQDIKKTPRWLCGRDHLARGPFGSFNWPWDVAFCGHKASDIDPVQGDVPLQVDIHQIAGSCDLAYPLRFFTDEEVWRLTKLWELPINKLRYGEGDAPNADSENFWNQDFLPYCMACMDPCNGPAVDCPKTETQVTNIHADFVKSQIKMPYCGG